MVSMSFQLFGRYDHGRKLSCQDVDKHNYCRDHYAKSLHPLEVVLFNHIVSNCFS